MIDESLPVRYSASISLPRILHWEISKTQLKAEVYKLLTLYIKLMNEVQSEDVIESLESVISAFPLEIQPFAFELTQYLASSFENSVQNTGKEAEDNSLAVVSMLNTMTKILEIFSDNQQEIQKLSWLLVNTLTISLKSCDYFEEGTGILNWMLYYAENESLSHFYQFFHYLYDAVLGTVDKKPFGSQYLEEIFPPVGNFIAKYPAETQANMGKVIELAIKLLDFNEEDEAFLSCQIMIALLENYRGNSFLQANIGSIIQKYYDAFNSDYSKKYKISCTQVIFMCIWNSPECAVAYHQIINSIADFARVSVKYYMESLAKIHLIYGLGSLFLVGLPNELQSNLLKFLQLMLNCAYDSSMEQLPTALESVTPVTVNLSLNIKSNENDWTVDESSDEDDDYPFGIEPTNFYDSKFESLNFIENIKALLLMLQQTFPELFMHFNSQMSEKEKKIAKYIIES